MVKYEHGRATEATAKGEPRTARAGEGATKTARAKSKVARASQGTARTARTKPKVARAVRWGSLANRGAEKEGERACSIRQSECKKDAAEQASQEAQARAQ